MTKTLLAVVALAAVACSASADSSTTLAAQCEDPPVNEVAAESELEMDVSVSPVQPDEVVELTVAGDGFPVEAVVGVDAEWQCWVGSSWMTTHIVYRGFGTNAGQTIPVNAEFQIRVPSIGLALGEGYPIVVPQVDPGIYRIEDEVSVEDASITGFTVIEVVDG